ncbi:MAG TPA: hypothetical protein VLU25_03355 [Acidobacteriota bacterium]|nr:hypothetical protein [Acidobacteriota bacterium]
MSIKKSLMICGLVLLASAALAAQNDDERWKTDPRLEEGQIAPYLEGLGDHSYSITAANQDVQKFFDQGLALTYGFNHAEAIRAFREGARRDPGCAMCFWGQALALGPNINSRMGPENAKKAYAAIQKAMALRGSVSDKEKALIEALAQRYAEDPEAERLPLDEAYRDAMRKVANDYPDDPDIQTFFAASVMNVNPWPGHEYWNKDGTPRPGTVEFTRVLEETIEKHPDHAGAHHYYIHAVEASPEPDLAVPSADKLGGLMPGAGHIVHMPSHVYIRVGRYADATRSNEMAVEADEDYITQCAAQGLYPEGYYPHNIHFIWAAASREGAGEKAIAAARKTASKVPDEMAHHVSNFRIAPFFALVRFGKWDEILAEPQPPQEALLVRGVWHYARGMAFRGQGHLYQAAAELDRLNVLLNDPGMDDQHAQSNPGELVLQVARHVLAGEILASKGRYDEAVAELSTAVRYEDGMTYTEPADWDFPARLNLGAVLLEAGRDFEAEVVYWEDLKRNPENGWALFGLHQALMRQGKEDQAALVKERFEKAWANADIELAASRF